ncbi:glycosyltransferase family 4 protein [Algoriphagus sp. D3-2-R+10]|uniref:glycosyltransferase family 4 protein n=1 Tax=Algoriphagus aurantiacus TaxID=3103948 RepID=UPI002B38039A|nr:glycosyltransferase family 4 protein [Algoriphagus sp. D3-2-R+10]MEB2778406.1 glycosyltransferase family 4 protein [Algoriphagus sp. D3-2-R+10]
MRVLLLVDDYIPKSTRIHGKMVHQLAAELAKAGHNSTVATPDSTIDKSYVREMLEGVEVLRFYSPETRVASKIRRAINESLLSYFAWKNLRGIFNREKFDLIIIYSPTIFFGPFVKIFKKKWGAETFLILRDVFPQWAIDQGLIKKDSIIGRYFKFFEKLNYNVSNRIALQSPKNKVWFDLRFPEYSEKTCIVYNWTNEFGDNLAYKTNYRNHLGLEGKIIFFYGGNMGEAQDMMNLVRLAENIKDHKHAHFVFVGNGGEYEKVKSSISSKKLENITLLDSVSQEVYKEMLAEFDIGLITLHRNHTTHNFPGKLLGYMAEGKPILGSVNTGNDLIELIEDSGSGYVTENGQDNIFKENALKLIYSNSLRLEMGKNGNKLLKNTFSTQHIIDSIIK